jgi:catechol 2,3-dioxygenase-like lactoylglutathione lyase family enzyme
VELTQVRLMVSDFPAVYRFYRDVLGLKPQFEAESGPYAKLSPDTGHAAIALQDRAQMAGVLGRSGTGPPWCPVSKDLVRGCVGDVRRPDELRCWIGECLGWCGPTDTDAPAVSADVVTAPPSGTVLSTLYRCCRTKN